MKDPRREYEAALADFSQPGNRWTAKGPLTYWGKAAGLTAEEIIADARAAGVCDRDADIRRGWNDAKPKGDRPQGKWHRAARTKPKPPPTFPRYVRDMIAAGGGEATSADLIALSPYDFMHGRENGNPQLTLAAWMRSLFDPADQLFVFRDDVPTAGKPGENLRTCAEWVRHICLAGALTGDLIVANVFSGAEGNTTGGRPSYVAQSSLARFPFIVVEFDEMPLARQCAFWRGLLATSPLAPNVASVVFSGGKSLHALLHVGCRIVRHFSQIGDPMFSITLITVGKLKEKFFISAAEEYAKRLRAYARFDPIELPEQRLPEGPSPAQITDGLQKEGAQILAKVPKGAWLCVLSPEGKMLSSEQLAETLSGVKSGGKSSACFVIGSSFGLAPEIKEKADLLLSMSRMTFPHHLARVMVLEQLYRAEAIQAGSKYHK